MRTLDFSANGEAAIHCFDLVCQAAQKRQWDDAATRINRSLRTLDG